ncbi:MAG: hypothetical protein EOP51_33140, partial [Sphingobacteriales bacterium]
TNIATAGAFQVTAAGSNNAFLAKFNQFGFRQWGTYYGLVLTDGIDVATAPDGTIVICGQTDIDPSLITVGAYQTVPGDVADIFISKFDSTGNRIWGTYLGGTNPTAFSPYDEVWGMEIDGTGNIVVAGITNSVNNIATPGSYQPAWGGNSQGFICKYDPTGTKLWGTYYGGTAVSGFRGVALGPLGDIYVTGTGLTNTAKFSSSGALLWLSGFSRGDAIAVDLNGNAYLTGLVTSFQPSISTPGAYQATVSGLNDGFVVKLNSNGVVQWGTYFGGPGNETTYGITTDPESNVIIAGSTTSTTNIATPNAFQSNLVGGGSAFIASFSPSGSPLKISLESIEAKNYGEINKLFWTLSSAEPGDYIEIERSADGVNFSRIALIADLSAG